MSGKREYGDYQTPQELANRIVNYVRETYDFVPDAVLEPTCGIGNFVESCLTFNSNIVGVEINPDYCVQCSERFSQKGQVKIINNSIFGLITKEFFEGAGRFLIIGNPPWVTTSTLSHLASNNVPQKKNSKGFRGYDALTGASNFDICENIIEQIVDEYKYSDTFIVMICKSTVCRNVYVDTIKKRIPFTLAEFLEIDAKKIFKINASAGVMVLRLTCEDTPIPSLVIKNFDFPKDIRSEYIYRDGRFHPVGSDIDLIDGNGCFDWRQGIKHDCAKVIELDYRDGHFYNGFSEKVEVEESVVFPLVKSSGIKSPIINAFSKYAVVVQKNIRDDISSLESQYPKAWSYFSNYRALFEQRKSSIYKDSQPFSMFGIGDYSFAKYKVGISGFYKKPLFALIYSECAPVVMDDTSYFIGFDDFESAYTAMLLLNSETVQKFLVSISFQDAKRPFTKKVLSRIDFKKVLKELSLVDLQNTERRLGLSLKIGQGYLEKFRGNMPLELTFE